MKSSLSKLFNTMDTNAANVQCAGKKNDIMILNHEDTSRVMKNNFWFKFSDNQW